MFAISLYAAPSALHRTHVHEQKVKIDKRDIAREAGVPYEDFVATISKMTLLCGDLVRTHTRLSSARRHIAPSIHVGIQETPLCAEITSESR